MGAPKINNSNDTFQMHVRVSASTRMSWITVVQFSSWWGTSKKNPVEYKEKVHSLLLQDILVEALTLTCIWKVSLLLFIFGAPMSIPNIYSSERRYYFFINFWETLFLLFIHLRDINTDNYGPLPSNYAFLENTFYIKFLFTYISPLFKYEQQPLINNTSSQQQQHPHSTQYSLINIVP